MSRYYKVEISDATSGNVVRTWTSYLNGQTDPGALDIELDLPVAGFAQPMGGSGASVTIWGISLQDIAQAKNFNPDLNAGKSFGIKVYGGMQKGLPLANPQQSGLLASGTIFQAFGNWVSTDQNLVFIFFSEFGTKNLSVTWKQGSKMADVITSTLQTAFPGYTSDIQISDSLVFPQDIPAHYTTIATFARWVQQTSASILNPPGSTGIARAGVDIILKDKKFVVRDDTTPQQPKTISFTDLMGQPTWYGPHQISVNLVMRGDISVLDYIKLPPTQMTTLPASQSQSKGQSVFQGVFRVNQMRHVGRYRAPFGEAWITTLFVVDVPKTTTSVGIQSLGN